MLDPHKKKKMFTLTVFEILLFKDRSLLSHAQPAPRSERVKVSVKNQKKYRFS